MNPQQDAECDRLIRSGLMHGDTEKNRERGEEGVAVVGEKKRMESRRGSTVETEVEMECGGWGVACDENNRGMEGGGWGVWVSGEEGGW